MRLLRKYKSEINFLSTWINALAFILSIKEGIQLYIDNNPAFPWPFVAALWIALYTVSHWEYEQ